MMLQNMPQVNSKNVHNTPRVHLSFDPSKVRILNEKTSAQKEEKKIQTTQQKFKPAPPCGKAVVEGERSSVQNRTAWAPRIRPTFVVFSLHHHHPNPIEPHSNHTRHTCLALALQKISNPLAEFKQLLKTSFVLSPPHTLICFSFQIFTG